MLSNKNFSISIILMVVFSFFMEASYAQAIKEITSDESARKIKKIRPIYRDQDDFKYHSVGLGVGQIFLQGGYKDYGLDAITWDFLYSYTASYSYDMLISLHSSTHERLNRELSLLGLSVGIKARIFQYDSFAPFVLGGLGFYSPTFDNGTSSVSKVVFGTNVALGAELDMKIFKIGLMGQLYNPFDVQQSQGPDIEGSYFKLLLTGLYSFR